MQSAGELPSEPMEKKELQDLVHNTVSSMPEHFREILLLSYFHQFPYKQISEILDIPLGTVNRGFMQPWPISPTGGGP